MVQANNQQLRTSVPHTKKHRTWLNIMALYGIEVNSILWIRICSFFRGRLAQVLSINRVDILDTYIERKGRQCVRWINKSPSSKATSSSLFVSSKKKKTRMIAGYHHWLSKSVTGLSFFSYVGVKEFSFSFQTNEPTISL